MFDITQFSRLIQYCRALRDDHASGKPIAKQVNSFRSWIESFIDDLLGSKVGEDEQRLLEILHEMLPLVIDLVETLTHGNQHKIKDSVDHLSDGIVDLSLKEARILEVKFTNRALKSKNRKSNTAEENYIWCVDLLNEAYDRALYEETKNKDRQSIGRDALLKAFDEIKSEKSEQEQDEIKEKFKKDYAKKFLCERKLQQKIMNQFPNYSGVI